MKNWFKDLETTNIKADLLSGFLVFLIALPLCLGIAMASNFPAASGIITAMVGGIVASLMGSARLTIKGPAAGLIVICLGAVTELGQGDASLGHKRAIATIMVAAGIQMVFAFMRLGRFANIIPPSAVHGMLAAIGIIIAAKQSHILLGYKPTHTNPLALIAEIPNAIMHMNPNVAVIGAACLALMFLFPMLAPKLSKKVPAQLLALMTGIGGGMLLHLPSTALVNLPSSFAESVTHPDFSFLGNWLSIKYVIMFALVGSIESLLTVKAVNSMDPKRTSDMDRDLFATGFANFVASALGGLPMISEIVRSKANIDSGAKSAWANVFHGVFLLVFVGLFPSVLRLIPMTALAALLIFTGFRLAAPAAFKHVYHIGRDELAVFLTTLILTLAVDLLVGVTMGVVLEFALDTYRNQGVKGLFRASFEVITRPGKVWLKMKGPMVFTNLPSIEEQVQKANKENVQVHLDISDSGLVDHTSQARLEELGVIIDATDKMQGVSDHKLSTKVPRDNKKRTA